LTAEDPSTIAGYRLTHRLGEGGMGRVYLSHTPGGRAIAIKVVRPELAADPEFRRRFQQEVRAAERVQGLYTAPVIDSDTEGPQPWLATAYVAGPSLHAAVRTHGPLPVPAAARALAGIAEALQVIHGVGVIHRDLKPSNVLLASDGPRVIDFGIARATDATSLTRSGVTAGTPAFMAPEQAMGQSLTPAVDVFALGLIAVFATVGMPPFGDGSSPAVLYRIVHEEPNLTGVPDALREVTARCLAKDPGQRPALAEVIEACRRLMGEATPASGGWLPPAVTAEIDQLGATVTSAAAAPPPVPAPPPAPPSPTPPAPVSHTAYPQSAIPTAPAGSYLPPVTSAPTAPGQRSRGGRAVLLVAIGLCLGLVGAAVGYTLLTGREGTGSEDGNPNAQQSQAGTTSGGNQDAGQDQNPGQDESATQEPAEPVADPEPAVYQGIDIPDGHIIWLYDDPPTPQETEMGVGYEGDFGLYADMFSVNLSTTDEDGYRMVLLEAGETGSLDTCRTVTRYTESIPSEEAPPGSEICLTTVSGDIGLIRVVDYSAADSPSTYVTIDLTVWRGAAELG
jgi:serine/threonine protein kinase